MKEMIVGIEKANEYKCPVCNKNVFDEAGGCLNEQDLCEHIKIVMTDFSPEYVSEELEGEILEDYTLFCDDESDNDDDDGNGELTENMKKHAEWFLDVLGFKYGKEYDACLIKECEDGEICFGHIVIAEI